MELDEVKSILQQCAALQPEIRRVWIFGSRVKGTHTAGSDLDVAVQLHDKEAPLACWVLSVEERLKKNFPRRCPFSVDWQLYINQSETPHIHLGLEEKSILVYDSGHPINNS